MVRDKKQADHEMFAPNTWYGSAKALKLYSGWKLPLPFVIPHGVSLSSTFLWQAEAQSGLPAVYCFPDFRQNSYAKTKTIKIIPGCSPWVYLNRMCSAGVGPGRGTLAFPSHSTHHVTALEDDKAYADYLLHLPKNHRPVKICMYWRDLELGRQEAFRQRGLEVVCAGHMFDELFFFRLHRLLSQCEFVNTSSLGSHVFYAASIGRRVTLRQNHRIDWSCTDEARQRDMSRADLRLRNELVDLFNGGQDLPDQRNCALKMLGYENIQSPMSLFGLIARTSLSKGWILRAIRHRV
jgi:hypothetical protein